LRDSSRIELCGSWQLNQAVGQFLLTETHPLS
jgi:hypothetical protein